MKKVNGFGLFWYRSGRIGPFPIHHYKQVRKNLNGFVQSFELQTSWFKNWQDNNNFLKRIVLRDSVHKREERVFVAAHLDIFWLQTLHSLFCYWIHKYFSSNKEISKVHDSFQQCFYSLVWIKQDTSFTS